MPELTQAQRLVYGADAKLHPVTGMPLENGSGALPDKQQALMHLAHIAREQGKDVADAMLDKIVGLEKAAEIKQRMQEAERGHENT
jgi:hypothetical protein